MIIEQNTNYAYKIKYMTNPTFDKVRELSTKFYLELPQELKDELYEALHRGIDILDSEPQMTAYIFAYGKMHQAKLNYAFDKLSDNFFEQEEINIVDYGCGQAIGTMCYADFLRKNHYLQKVKTITLIEPSEICLKRAALHTSVFFPDAEIKTVNKGFNGLNEKDIVCNENIPTLHILSNVLDILNFDIYNFAELIKNNLKGKNQFVCVAPYYNGNEKDNRMDLFASKINGSDIITRKYKANEFIPEKEWTCKMICFQKNMDSFEMKKDSGLKQHTIYYEADEKIEDDRLVYGKEEHCKWIQDNSISHNFSNGKGKIILKNGVNEIGENAFYFCSGLTSITIPNSITRIGKGAFYNCNGLTEIKIPDSVTEIEDFTFSECGLKSIFIPNSVTKIGKNAFDFCQKLTAINIPDSVIEIGDSAFSCSGLTSVTIPDSVTSIGHDAFRECYGLISVTIGNSVSSIGDYAFGCCCKLTKINIPNSVTKISDGTFYDCQELSEINIPDSVTKIGEEAFSGCNGLTIVIIPYSITKIGKGAFYNCSGLTEIKIPDSVTEIDIKAFSDCCKLTKINIPNSITKISAGTFYGCEELSVINIPNSVTEIGDEAFSYCCGLISVTIPDSVIEIGRNAFYQVKNIVYNGTEIESPWGALSENGFFDGHLIYSNRSKTKLTGCSTLATKIKLPICVTEIGDNAFYGCKNLTNVIIPNSVTHIGVSAFAGCSGLTSIVIPDSVTEIGHDAFIGCYGITSLSLSNSLTEISDNLFWQCKSLKSVVIPDSIKKIGETAFCGCSGLETVIIPYSVTEIGDAAFIRCIELDKIIVEKNNTIYDSRNNCNAIIDTESNTLLIGCKNTIIPDSVTNIGNLAFSDCGLTSITIPNSVIKIGEYSFADCKNMTTINIPNSVIEIGDCAFEGCDNLPKEIRKKIEIININALYGFDPGDWDD